MALRHLHFLPAFAPSAVAPFHTKLRISSPQLWQQVKQRKIYISHATSGEDKETLVGDLTLPQEWTCAEAAAKEKEWLREALQRWLDEEFCPEEANIEISKRCANVYYHCLLEKEIDAANILMRMIQDLQTFSFRHSFHGAFSSANAALELIIQKSQHPSA